MSLIAAAFLVVAELSLAQTVPGGAEATQAEQYARARRAFDEESDAYWSSIAEKRRVRNAKRRNGEPIELDDYVLTQPPVYRGPPRPAAPGSGPPAPRKPAMPVVADFLKAAAEEFGFVPQRPDNDLAFKQAYAQVASAAGLTRDQAVRVYAFETGGNGTYDVQAGLTHPRPGARAISPALGYNQLLSTNSVGLLAEHGDQFVHALGQKAEGLTGDAKVAMERKIEALRRMVAFSRTVPNVWSEHDNLAKNTAGGLGIHAANLDRDIGPLLQTQKLLNSVLFARSKGRDSAVDGGRARADEFHRRWERARHGHDAAGPAGSACRPRIFSSSRATSAIPSRARPASLQPCLRRSRPGWITRRDCPAPRSWPRRSRIPGRMD